MIWFVQNNNKKVKPMLKLLFKKTHPKVKQGLVEPELPKMSVSKDVDFTMQIAHLKRYDAMTGWPEHFADIVHPAYLAMRALTLQEPLISDHKQPFAGLGLVHMGNKMHYTRMLKKSEKITLSCAFGQLWEHKLGWVFSVNTQAYAQDDPSQPVMTLESHYLYRQQRKPEKSQLPQYLPEKIPFMQYASESQLVEHKKSSKITVDNSLARSYARLSGDYNPIHLFTWSARLFGFKQPIIHGMWTKARVLSTWFSQHQTFAVEQPCTIDVQFMRFISLPNTFTVHAVQVAKTEQQKIYLAGMPADWNKNLSTTQAADGTVIEPPKPLIQISIS
jgi:acyl dehydratase